VLVIGGGPAGSTAATLARRKGFDVLLLERAQFPRPHVGESLLPASLPILALLGVLERIENHGFIKKHGATMVWGSDREPWTWSFREANGPFVHSYQVVRSEFDQILLEHARGEGVRVEYGHRALEPIFTGKHAVGARVEQPDGSVVDARARFIIDASGQQAVFAHGLGMRKWDDFFRNVAVYGYFEDAEHLDGELAGNIFIESYDRGWSWKIPLHNGQSSVGVVIDADQAAESLGAALPEEVLLEQLQGTEKTSTMLRDARLVRPPEVIKDWSYMSESLAGPGYALAGDAGCFVDPLFSSGVHLALTSGMLAAAHAVTTLKDPALERASGRAYTLQYRRKYSYFRELAQFFYGSNRAADSYFWQARTLSDDEWSGTAREAFVNIVSGHPPEGYERAVIERGDAPAPFLERVEAAEAGRRERRTQVRDWVRSGGGIPTSPGAAFLDAVPRFASGVSMMRILAADAGEFGWTQALSTPANPEGAPVTQPVAQLLSMIDARRSIREIIRRMRAPLPREHHSELTRSVVAKLSDLYVEGSVELRTPT
jgi:halogenation protein CepH